MSMVVTVNNPSGQRTVAFSLGTDEISGVFVALLIVLLSRLLEEWNFPDDGRAPLSS